MDSNVKFLAQGELKQLKFFDMNQSPSNIIDYELTLTYQKYLKEVIEGIEV